MSVLESANIPLELIKSKIDELRDFLNISLSIANAHTVDFYTCNVWEQFIAVPPESVLSIFRSYCDQKLASGNRRTQRCEKRGGKRGTSFGFCDDTKRLVDVAALIEAACRHTLPELGVSVLLPEVLQTLGGPEGVPPTADDILLEPAEFMNSKKSHEVQIMSGVVACLAQRCGVRQVIDVGSGKGYLCSFLSLKYSLQVYGIDSSSRNTHGARERNRKLQKYSRAYQRRHNSWTAVNREREHLQGERDQSKRGGERKERSVQKERDRSECGRDQGMREQPQEERDQSKHGGEREGTPVQEERDRSAPRGEQGAREPLQEERDRSERGREQGTREQLQEERDRSEHGGEQGTREQLQEERDRSEHGGGQGTREQLQEERDRSEHGGEQGTREQLQEERDRSEHGGGQGTREQPPEERDLSSRGAEQGTREQPQEERDLSSRGGEQGTREQLQEERDQSACRGEQGAREQLQDERDQSEQEEERDCAAGFKPFKGQDSETLTVLLEASVTMAPAEDSPMQKVSDALSPDMGAASSDPESPFPFLIGLSPDLVETPPLLTPPIQLSPEERERRKRENLERKGLGSRDSLFSPLTSYITAHSELHDIITNLEGSLLVGLHTCGDLAPSTLYMFTAKPELRAVCSVGCCYHLLSEEFDPTLIECPSGQWGFPMSKHLREPAWFCGRNARMSACLALERVSAGGGLPSESLFYRAVLHVILRDHYGTFKSEKRVGNIYSKSASFVEYVRRALRKLGLDGSKISDCLIQGYHEEYSPRKEEMQAFNLLKVSLAPCIEALILLDRLCYLKEQENTCFSAVVQLFDPLKSPRCYGIVALKNGASECSKNNIPKH